MGRLRAGEWIAGAGGVALIASLFLHWYGAAVPDELASPWLHGGIYQPDLGLLERLITVQVDGGQAATAASGGLAIAIDVWIATELRRAGVDADAVWPRAKRPRALPQGLARGIEQFRFSSDPDTRIIQEQTIAKLSASAGAGHSNILGGFFMKEIDVVMADYDRGLELAVSTKTMTGSAAKNVGNRFEEAAGDLLNIRKRYPLATFGYGYLVTSNVPEKEPAAWERIKDMCRKLTSLSSSEEGASYDASCLIVADIAAGKVSIDSSLVPDDLAPWQFFETMLGKLFSRSPVAEHAGARKLWLDSDPNVSD